MFAKERYAEEALMKKALAMHEESSSVGKTEDDVNEGSVPTYLLDRENTTRAKVLSNTIKQKRKEKAGNWEVPLPKLGLLPKMRCSEWSGRASTRPSSGRGW